MKVIAAYMLCVLGGKDKPTVEEVQQVLKSVGSDVPDNEIQKLVDTMERQEYQEVLERGKKKLAIMNVPVEPMSQVTTTSDSTTTTTIADSNDSSSSDDDDGQDLFSTLW
jgi:large subunit ribosomal protein LP2